MQSSDDNKKVLPLVAPSILACNWNYLGKEINDVESAGADWIHMDVMDGHFVPPITFGADIVKSVRHITKLPLDVHLMIEKPELQIKSFADAGADIITVHQEVCPHLHRVVEQIREVGKKVGVSINPATPVSVLTNIINDIDLLLIMTVNPGWGGQKFIESCANKVLQAFELIKNSKANVKIEVDGGVNAETAKLLVKQGAAVLVAGTYVFKSDSYKGAIELLKRG